MNDQDRDKLLTKAGELLAVGRAIVKKRAPYITTTLYGLIPRPVWDPEVTIGVTPGFVLYFNPVWLTSDPDLQDPKDGPETMAGCLFHECWHPLHGWGRIDALAQKGMRLGIPEQEAHTLANIADDLAINYAARLAQWKLPSWVCYPEMYGLPGGLLMEEYWEKLVQQRGSQTQNATPQPTSGTQQAGGEKAKPGPCAGNCGGAAGSTNFKDLEKKLDEEVGRHQADRDRIQKTTISEMADHEERNGRGSVPGFHAERFNFTKTPKLVRWETRLRHILSNCTGHTIPGDDEYSMLRPDKHSALLGICLPGTIDQEPELAFIRDTSGSMSPKDLNTANNEIINAMSALGVSQVWLLDADVKVQGKPKRVGIKDIPGLEFKGRGGTSFIEPLQRVAKLYPRPDIVIYLTDGDGYAPEKKPRNFEVVWCIVPGRGERKPTPWGHLVICSNAEKG